MPQNIHNYIVSAGAQINITSTMPGARSFRVSKKKKEAKKAKKIVFETPEGLRAEAARLIEAADREEEEVRRKRAKAKRLSMEAEEMEKKIEKRVEGDEEMVMEDAEQKAGEEGEVVEEKILEVRFEKKV
ncbi:Hypothetical protein PENO1_059790 [Penicillium occitanis (nom. inval.)]|nr:Hypothetical protein PENO1_059790 [Penicillium occitanis (nom. inval.)]PCH01698.1 hypothetical protein PENOC_046780 [Penicillium occitanis (nom. inval.)]